MNRCSLSTLFLLLMMIGLVSLPLGCSSGTSSSTSSSAQSGPTPTAIPTSIVPTNPTYQVQRGDVVRLLQFSGRAAPVREEEIFFRAFLFTTGTFFTLVCTALAFTTFPFFTLIFTTLAFATFPFFTFVFTALAFAAFALFAFVTVGHHITAVEVSHGEWVVAGKSIAG